MGENVGKADAASGSSGSTESSGVTEVRTFCRVCEPACGLIAEVRSGEIESLSLLPKSGVSAELFDRIEKLREGR